MWGEGWRGVEGLRVVVLEGRMGGMILVVWSSFSFLFPGLYDWVHVVVPGIVWLSGMLGTAC